MDEAFKSILKRTWRRRRAYNTAMFWLCCSEFRKLEVHSLKKKKLGGFLELVLAVGQHSEGTMKYMALFDQCLFFSR